MKLKEAYNIIEKEYSTLLSPLKEIYKGHHYLATVFPKLKKKFNIVKKIESEDEGLMYLLQDGRIMRITDYDYEVRCALKFKDKNLKHYAKIYDIVRLNSDLFIIFMEHLKEMSWEDRQIVRDTLDYGTYDEDSGYSKREMFISEQTTELYEQITSFKAYNIFEAHIGWKKNGNLAAFGCEVDDGNIKVIPTIDLKI